MANTSMVGFASPIDIVKDGRTYTLYGVEGGQVLYHEADPRYHQLRHPKQMSITEALALIQKGTRTPLTHEQKELLGIK